MSRTTIEWTDYTFNPWWGCARVSPGCEHCYCDIAEWPDDLRLRQLPEVRA